MALTDYTTYDEVRAVLGVAEEELEDVTLALPIYETLLEEDLADLSPNMEANYTAVKGLPTPSPNETRFLRLISAWSAYRVAIHLLSPLAMFGPKVIESDKDKEERIQDPYAALREQVPVAANVLKGRILALYAILFPGESQPVPVDVISVVVVGLGTDPITGV